MSKNIDIHTAMTWSAKRRLIDKTPRLQDWFSEKLPDQNSVWINRVVRLTLCSVFELNITWKLIAHFNLF